MEGGWGMDFQESMFTMAASVVMRLPTKDGANVGGQLRNQRFCHVLLFINGIFETVKNLGFVLILLLM